MQEWILFMALVVAAAALTATGVAFVCFREREREKDRGLIRALREQDRLVRELEHLRIEKQTVENIVRAMLPQWDQPAGPTTSHGQNPPRAKKGKLPLK